MLRSEKDECRSHRARDVRGIPRSEVTSRRVQIFRGSPNGLISLKMITKSSLNFIA